MDTLNLGLQTLKSDGSASDASAYRLSALSGAAWDWDASVRTLDLMHCWYNRGCAMRLYVKDGVALRTEQVGDFPAFNDPTVPDINPKGCQKGLSFPHRMYDPSRLKYPLKRVGERGAGQWQRVSWDQVLSEIADTLIDVLSTEGNEVVLSFRSTHASGTANMSAVALELALGLPLINQNIDQADEFPGVALTWGKICVGGSADNWFHADTIYIWGTNPAYTQITSFHFLSEARYNGTKVVVISPDYSPTAPFADVWVPVNVGSDAALALAMAQVMISRRLYKADFVREQTDLPLLVYTDSRRFLRQTDLRRGGREDVFYIFDEASRKVVEAPRNSLALGGLAPSLDGEYVVDTLEGKKKVRPVFALLKEHLDQDYTPEQAAPVTGVSPGLIEQLAVDFARSRGVVHPTSPTWGKHYHGDLIERAQVLLWALCGHFGRKGASYDAWTGLPLDSSFGGIARAGGKALVSAGASDPRMAAWREQGYTDEMIVQEYMADPCARGDITNVTLLYHLQGGGLEVNDTPGSKDPYLKRPVDAYLKEALDKGWQVAVPRRGKEPRTILERGGSFLHRSRSTKALLENLLPKLKMLVTCDFRMGSTALYSDYILPCAAAYEKFSILGATPDCPFMPMTQKAVEPLGDTKSEWEIYLLLAKKVQERAIARGIRSFTGRDGKEVRLDNLYDFASCNGMYTEEDEEAVARDYYFNATNVESMDWEDFKRKGHVRVTGLSAFEPDNACDIAPGEPIVPFTHHVAGKQPYPTLTRRMQFYIDHEWFFELGEALPTHKDIPKIGGDHPIQVTGGHARWSIHSVCKDSPLLLRLQRGEPIMFMSAADARARGIQDGDLVEAFNDIASIRVHAAVSAAVRPGQAIIYHDWENFMFQEKMHFKGLYPSPLNPIELVGNYGHIKAKVPFYSGTPGPNDRGTRVEIAKAATGEGGSQGTLRPPGGLP